MPMRRLGDPSGGQVGGGSTGAEWWNSIPSAKSSLVTTPYSGATGGMQPDAHGNTAARPHSDFGKFNPNAFGTIAGYMNAAKEPLPRPEEPKPGVLHGVPVLGNIFDAIGTVGNVLSSEGVGDLVPVLGQQDMWQRQSNWARTDLTPEDRAAKQKIIDSIGQSNALTFFGLEQNTDGKITEGRAQAEFLRYMFDKESGGGPKLVRDIIAPGGIGLGGSLAKVMGLVTVLQRGTQRTVAGMTNRVGALQGATDAELLKNAGPEAGQGLIDIRNKLAAGTMKPDDAMDELILTGYGLANPFGDSVQGHAASLITEVFSDPISVLSLGTGTVARLSVKAAMKGAVSIAAHMTEEEVGGLITRQAEKGFKLTIRDPNFLRLAMEDPALKSAVDAGMKDVSGVSRFLIEDAPTIVRIGTKAQKVLDLFQMFGPGEAGHLTTEKFTQTAADGVVKGFGPGSVRGLQTTVRHELGSDAERTLNEAIGKAATQTIVQAGNELSAAHAMFSKSVAFLNDPTAVARRMMESSGGGVKSLVHDKIERVKLRYIPDVAHGTEAMYARLRGVAETQLRTLLPNADPAVLKRVAAGLDKDGLALLDYAHYGHVSDAFIEVQQAAIRNGAHGAIDSGNLTLLAPRQIRSQEFDKLVALATRRGLDGMAQVRNLIARHDELARVWGDDMTDVELKKLVKETYKEVGANLPSEIDASQVAPELQKFLGTIEGQGYSFGLRPKDLSGAVYDKAGKLIGAHPWIDLVSGGNAIQSVGRMKVARDAMFAGISGRTVQREARRRFAFMMAEEYGVSEGTSARMFKEVQREAERMEVSTRGMTRKQIYEAVTKVKMPASMKSKMTERSVGEMVVRAHEGSLSVVGLTQKFTGVSKTIGMQALGENSLGILAEAIYPLLRFKKNAFFVLQEIQETPLWMLMRGRLPMEDLRRIWTKSGRADIGREVHQTEYLMQKLTSRTGAEHLPQEMADLAALERGQADALKEGLKHTGFWSHIPSIAPVMHDVKHWGVARSWEYEQASLLGKSLEAASPEMWRNYIEWARFRHGARNERVAIRNMYLDSAAMTDPESLLLEFGHSAMRPEWMGSRSRVAPTFMKWATLGEDHGKTTMEEFYRRLRDPLDHSLTPQHIEDALRARSASEDYIARATHLASFPEPEEFAAALKTLGRSDAEIAAHTEAWKLAAQARGQTVKEYLADQWSGAPMTINAVGDFRGTTHFQYLTDSLETRGVTVLDRTDPLVAEFTTQGGLDTPGFRKAIDSFDPHNFDAKGNPVHLQGTAVTKMTDEEQKVREWLKARHQREAEPKLGASQSTVTKNGEPHNGRFYNDQGQLIHVVGTPTPQELQQMTESVLSEPAIHEMADWYNDTRLAILAMANNDPQQASRLMQGFVATQGGGAVDDGFKSLWTIHTRMLQGESVEDIIAKGGLGKTNPKLMATGLAEGPQSSTGLAQKLTDFSDSLFGLNKRSTGIDGPKGTWRPFANDIHMQRMFGHVDEQMTNHLGYLFPGGKVTEAADGFTVITKEGDTLHFPREGFGGPSPTHLEYDHNMELANDTRDYLNGQNWLGRSDWTTPELQSVWWMTTKKSMGNDVGGQPYEAMMRNRYNVNHDVFPSPRAPLRDVFPVEGLPIDTQNAIAARLQPEMDAIVTDMLGIHMLPGYTSRGLHGAQEVQQHVGEVLGPVEHGSNYGVTMAFLKQQDSVSGSRLAVKTASPGLDDAGRFNNRYHSIEFSSLKRGASATRQDAEKAMTQLSEAHPELSAGMRVIRNDDGGYGVRYIHNFDTPAPVAKNEFKKAMKGVTTVPDGFEPGAYHVVDAFHITNDWEKYPNGEQFLGHLRANGQAAVADRLGSGDGLIASRVRARYESVYSSEAPRETATFRTQRAAADPNYATRAGHLDASLPDGHAVLAGADAHPDGPLFQRGPRGILGAYGFDGESGRASLYLNGSGPKRLDTTAHELGHDVVAKMDPSGRQQLLDAYNLAHSGTITRRGGVDPAVQAVYDAKLTAHEAAVKAHADALAAHKASLGAEGLPQEAVDAAQAAHSTEVDRLNKASKPNSANAEKRLDMLDEHGYDTGASRDLLDEYRSTTRSDFGSSEDYAGAREDIWNEYVDSVDNAEFVPENHPDYSQAATAPHPGRAPRPPKPPSPTPSVEFTPSTTFSPDVHEWAANQYVSYLRTGKASSKELEPLMEHYSKVLKNSRTTAKPNAAAQELFDRIDRAPKREAYGYNVDQQALMGHTAALSQMAQRRANDFIHFKSNRSWLERSANHPYFGLYPASYMWGKVIPETMNFLMFKPFGFSAPGVALLQSLKAYNYISTQIENDSELRAWMTNNEPAFRSLAMNMPGLPWDSPANAPMPLRRVVEGVTAQVEAEQAGKVDKDGNPIHPDLTKIDWGKIASDTAQYAFDPTKGITNTVDAVMGAKTVGDLGFNAVSGQGLPGSEPLPNELPAITNQPQDTMNEPQLQPVAPQPQLQMNPVVSALTSGLTQSGGSLVQELESPTP